MLRSTIFAIVIGVFLEAGANLPAAPSLKPDPPYASKVVSTQDARRLSEALDGADRGDWDEVARLQAGAGREIVADLILWRRATQGAPDMGFDEKNQALDRLKDWPDTRRIRAHAEELIDTSALGYSARIDWLRASGPVSADGKIALANALAAEGEEAAATERVRALWHDTTLDRSQTRTVLARHGARLSQGDHRKRVDFLLWTNQRSAAARLKPRLTEDWRRLVEARIKLLASQPGVDAAIRAVPEHLQDNPGLLHDRARWRRRHGLRDGALELLVGIDGADAPPVGRHQLWDEREIAMRRALKDAAYLTAYKLAHPHGLSEGVDFAEAEWAAGWISLRFLDDPLRAAEHFERLGQGVTTPISQARADYWSGRAMEALGEAEAARSAYREAADFSYTYYGQLAAEKIGATGLDYGEPGVPTDEDRTAFEARALVKAMRLLAEAGEERLFARFAFHLDDQFEDANQFRLLKALAEEYHQLNIAVRGAKSGVSRRIFAVDVAYPKVDYPLMREPKVERALMLALARQESEMNPRAVSYANARGLMQFLPATARLEARQRDLPYRTSWLIDDPGYNMTLGGAHLDTLLERFNGSYIMAIAAYNAGARRPARWVREYGDPRKGEIDPVDWVELIPFSQTRNYVQRVLENTQVYRHRLTGAPTQIRLSEDLARGPLR